MQKKDKALVGNEKVEEEIVKLKTDFSEERLAAVLTAIRMRMNDKGQFVVAVDALGSNTNLTLKTANFESKKWFVAYSSFEEEMKGNIDVMSGFLADISELFNMTLKSPEVEGIILNPFGNMITLNKNIINVILEK